MVFLILIFQISIRSTFLVPEINLIKEIKPNSFHSIANRFYLKEECYNNNVYTNRIEISSNVCIINCIFRSIGESSISGGAVYISINNRNENQNIIQNSTFNNCFSNKGGAFYISSQYDINIKFEYCSFTNNAVSIKESLGGAIYINSINNIIFDKCNFTINSVNSEYQDGKSSGGSIYSHISNLILNNCIFKNNKAYTTETETVCEGSAIYLFSCESNCNNCLFDDNLCSKKIADGCISIDEFTNIIFSECNFTNNKAYGEMTIGTVYMYNSNVTFKTCFFVNNTLSTEGKYSQCGGGAIYISEARASFENCIFKNNSAYASGIDSFSGGGAITSSLGDFTIENCHFIDNIANEGEFIFLVEKSDSNLKISQNIFERNINTMSQMKSLIYLDFEDGLANVNSFVNNKVFLFNTDRILLFDCYIDNSIQRKWIFNENCIYPYDQQYFKSDSTVLYDESGQNIIEFANAFQQECPIQSPEQSSESSFGDKEDITSEFTHTSIQSEIIDIETSINIYESNDISSISSNTINDQSYSSDINVESNDIDSSVSDINSDSFDSKNSFVESNIQTNTINIETSANMHESNDVISSISEIISDTSDTNYSNDNLDSSFEKSFIESNFNNNTYNMTLASSQTQINQRSYSFSISFSITYFFLRSVSYSFIYSFGNLYTMAFSDGEFYTTIITESYTFYNIPYIIFYLSASYIPSYIPFFIRKPKITAEQLIGIVCGTTAVFFLILYVIIRYVKKPNNDLDYLDWTISDEIDNNINENASNKDYTSISKNKDDSLNLDSSNDYDVDFWL